MADRSLTPMDHIRAAWNNGARQLKHTNAVHAAAPVPDGVKHALEWMRTCEDFEAWILSQLHKWTAKRDALQRQTQNWRQQLSKHARAVLPPTYNGPLHEQMLHEAAYQDLQVIKDIESGFPMAGIMPDSCLFHNVPSHELPRPEQLEAALTDALHRRTETLHEMFDNMRTEPEMEEVIKVTEKELKQGKFAGPWEVWRDRHGNIHSTVPIDDWLPTRRFPRVQRRTGTSYAVRPIDDCTASGLNVGACTSERMKMCGLEVLLRSAHLAAELFRVWGDDGQIFIAKGDHEKAYRQWPVHPEHCRYLICLVWDDSVGESGGFKAYAHLALPFGAFGAVWGYTRVSASVVHILRRLFSIPQMAFVDDFFRPAPRRFAALLQYAFRAVHDLLGIPLKEEKDHEPAMIMDLLGLRVAIGRDWAGCKLTEARRLDLVAAVDGALRSQALARREAARLGGQLGFAATALFGRIGRVYAAQVSAHAGPWSGQLQAALEWWKALLGAPVYHMEQNSAKPRLATAWVDGSWDMDQGTGAVGGLLLTEDRGCHSFSARIPAHLAAQLSACGKRQRNTQSELLAILVLLLTFPETLRGAQLILFEDNWAALSNVLSGAAADEDSQALVGVIWLLLGVLRIHVRVDYIPSEGNPADSYSRPDELEKREEAARYSELLGVAASPAVFPACVRADAGAWTTSLAVCEASWRRMDRRERANTAAAIHAFDPATLASLLGEVSIDARDHQVVLGWAPQRRRGIIAKATHWHGELVRYLCLAAQPHLAGRPCTTVVLARGRLPALRAATATALAVARPSRGDVPGTCTWHDSDAGAERALQADSDAVVVGFFAERIEGRSAAKSGAKLLRVGMPIWGA